MGLLSETQIKATKSGPKEFFLNDGDNLFPRVRSSGKAWIYRYDRGGKTIKLGLGPYPAVTLAQARSKAYEASSLRAGGQDLREVRRQREEQERVAALNTFELLSRAWVANARKDRQWSSGYAGKVIRHLELHVFPWVGDRPIEKIGPTEIVSCLHRIKDRGNLETAQRVREAVQHVYQYAVDVDALEPSSNFVNRNTGGLPAPRSRHYAAITDPAQLGQLLRDIRDYNGAYITRCALRLAPVIFQRPGQLRLAEWEDIHLDDELWRCPPEKMKLREWQKRDSRTPAHLVPLPRQPVRPTDFSRQLPGPAPQVELLAGQSGPASPRSSEDARARFFRIQSLASYDVHAAIQHAVPNRYELARIRQGRHRRLHLLELRLAAALPAESRRVLEATPAERQRACSIRSPLGDHLPLGAAHRPARESDHAQPSQPPQAPAATRESEWAT